MDDFPALASLYAGAEDQKQGSTKRSGSGEVGAAAAAEARANKSLVMRVERVAVTGQLRSLVPWSRVRRYERVHVKGITLRLRQVNGILNFSFLALRKAKDAGGADGGSGGVSGGNRGGAGHRQQRGSGGDGHSNSGSNSISTSGMDELDLKTTITLTTAEDGEEGAEDETPSLEDRRNQDEEEHAEELERERELFRQEEDELRTQHDDECHSRQSSFDTMSEGGSAGGGSTGGMRSVFRRGTRRRLPTPWAATAARWGERQLRQKSNSARTTAEDGAGLLSSPPPPTGGANRGRSMSGTMKTTPIAPVVRSQQQQQHRAQGQNLNSGVASRMSYTEGGAGGGRRESSRQSENLGNLGVVRVLGEAFMRRFNAYAEQVGVMLKAYVLFFVCRSLLQL